MPDIETAAGNREVNVRMLVKLSAVRMLGAEDTDLQALFAGPPEHGPGCSTEQSIEKGQLLLKKGSPASYGRLVYISHDRVGPGLENSSRLMAVSIGGSRSVVRPARCSFTLMMRPAG